MQALVALIEDPLVVDMASEKVSFPFLKVLRESNLKHSEKVALSNCKRS